MMRRLIVDVLAIALGVALAFTLGTALAILVLTFKEAAK
jgi:hypothetical protein